MTELEAGRELDARVAEEVMGWTLLGSEEQQRSGCGHPPGTSPYSSRGYSCPKYSTNIAAAWEVVEKLDTKFDFQRFPGSDLAASFGSDFYSYAETAPLAICRAALKAVA